MSGCSEPRLTLPEANRYVTEVRFTQPKPIDSTGSYMLLLLFLCLLYTNLTLLVPALDAVRPAQLVALGGLLMLFMEVMLSRRGICMVWPESYMLLAFLGACILSSFTALWMRLAVDRVMDLAKMSAIYFLIVNSVDSEARLRGVMWAMILGGVAPAVGTVSH